MDEQRSPFFSIIIPAFNEAAIIEQTIRGIHDAARTLVTYAAQDCQIMVVDNASTDNTAELAARQGVSCAHEPTPGIGRARNLGASSSSGRYLLFLDADVEVSPLFLLALYWAIERDALLVGAPVAIYRPRKMISWLICGYWDWKRSHGGAAQGVGQFYDRQLFLRLRGYDATLRMSEDVDLYVRADQDCQVQGLPRATIVGDAVIWPSTRRYDKWSSVRMLMMQNPLVAKAQLRNAKFWSGWRERAIR